MPQEPILSFKDVLKKRPGGRGYELLIESFSIFPKDRLALIGDSGSGKSTILDLAALILKPESAASFYWRPGSDQAVDLFRAWEEKDVSRFERIRRLHLGYVTQTGGLLPFLSVRDNILLPAKLKKMGPLAAERLKELAQELKIADLLDKVPAKLSVGQRQRCAIARALIHRPSLVLADEPTASLDPPTARQALDLLLSLSGEQAIVVSTHNLDLIKGQGFAVYQVVCEGLDPNLPVSARLLGPKAQSASLKASPRSSPDPASSPSLEGPSPGPPVGPSLRPPGRSLWLRPKPSRPLSSARKSAKRLKPAARS
ncbi:MAG: ABC transporter ATP-binding protein, partial [Deltaproteobacteria bacterium]|nr:ABC transporter ATP-binding protein [Deltaproteobacteria bacterium]